MEALGKRKRGDDAGGGDAGCSSGGGDRLSALPDHLLHEVMSRMKARQMVQTCALSRRWRHLWPKVPCLDIDQRELKAGHEKFDDFVYFLLRKVSVARLDAFRLHANEGGYDPGLVATSNASAWIRRAIMASAQAPPARDQGLTSPGSWRLRRLHLSGLRLDGLFAEHVRSRCPYLEDLELRVCKCRFRAIASGSLESLALIGCAAGAGVGEEFSEISSPALKSLVVDHGSNDIASPFVVTAPALAHLFLVVTPYNFPGGVSLGEMPSLARASVHLKTRETLAKRAHLRSHLFKILRSVSNVTSLELNGFDVTVKAGEESTEFPEFSNLRTLELDQCGLGHDIHVSGHILRKSPNLEKLTFTLSKSCWQVPVGEPPSYPELKNMRALTLRNYDPDDDFQTLGSFLQSSPVLENLTLQCCKSSKDTRRKKGTSKMKSIDQNLMDARCENLKLTKIIYRDDDVGQLVEFLLRFSRNLPNNNIRLVKVD
ncbi:putative FBD-associated F-box protein [Panicum miliaceum]|uniref:FBD-associated F-box protein n=1 Tax=Panicum miliaceum TaxID=4540 RepID=A0A3L6Q5S2_PANMI|nr:putative FBD-associated F-box protein [Panicum miliaceum]